MTTRGDIIIRNASNVTARLGIGSNKYVLTSYGTDISCQPTSGGGSFSAVGGNKSIIEFAGNSTCLIKPNSLGTASANGYFKL
jgi:calcineurin-like phosphoesterase